MTQQYYLPREDGKKATWLNKFYQQLTLVSSVFGITTAELNQLQEDVLVFAYALGILDTVNKTKEELTKFKNLVRSGLPIDTMAFPVIPTAPTPPASIAKLGIFKRVTKLVRRIKAHPAYNFSYGEKLGIEGDETEFDPATYQPKITVKVTPDGRVIDFTKSYTDGVNIYRCLRGTNNWVFINRDVNPPYLDAETFTEHVELEYRVRAVLKDKEIGEYSDVKLVVV